MAKGDFVKEFRQRPDLNKLAAVVLRARRNVKRARMIHNGVKFYRFYRKMSRIMQMLNSK